LRGRFGERRIPEGGAIFFQGEMGKIKTNFCSAPRLAEANSSVTAWGRGREGSKSPFILGLICTEGSKRSESQKKGSLAPHRGVKKRNPITRDEVADELEKGSRQEGRKGKETEKGEVKENLVENKEGKRSQKNNVGDELNGQKKGEKVNRS